MTERDSTTANVDFFSWELENPFGTNSDDGEGLVELPKGDIVFADTGSLESFGDSKGRGGREVDRRSSGIGVT